MTDYNYVQALTSDSYKQAINKISDNILNGNTRISLNDLKKNSLFAKWYKSLDDNAKQKINNIAKLDGNNSNISKTELNTMLILMDGVKQDNGHYLYDGMIQISNKTGLPEASDEVMNQIYNNLSSNKPAAPENPKRLRIKLPHKYTKEGIKEHKKGLRAITSGLSASGAYASTLYSNQANATYILSAENAQNFAKSLENNKATLMSDLGLTNKDYDKLANMAMALAEQETHYAKQGATFYTDTRGNSHFSPRAIKKHAADGVGYNLKSKGLTQIRFRQNFNDNNKRMRAIAEKYGITSDGDYANSPEKSAILTMIALSDRLQTVRSEKWQTILQNNNAKIADKTKQMTEEDTLALLWNKSEAFVTRIFKNRGPVDIDLKKSDKNATDGCEYAKNLRIYREKLFGETNTHY